jgi:hypothetical protein
LEEDNTGAVGPRISLSSIWYREIIGVILRCLVDESGFKRIREALWPEFKGDTRGLWLHVRSAFAPLISRDFRHAAGVDAKYEAALRTCVSELGAHRIAVGVSGYDFRVAQLCSGIGGSNTEPRLYMALAFLFSEFVTNTFKHQYHELGGPIATRGLSMGLEVIEASGSYRLVCRFTPVDPAMKRAQTDWTDGSDKTFIGLRSIKSTLAAIGCQAHSERVRWRLDGREWDEELPFFEVEHDSSRSATCTKWTISNLARRGVTHE